MRDIAIISFAQFRGDVEGGLPEVQMLGSGGCGSHREIGRSSA